MTLNERDKQVLEFISICPSESSIVKELFFPSLQTCQRRLNKLHDEGLVKRYRTHASDSYIYYLNKKPRQIEHSLYVSRLYVYWIKAGYEIVKFKCTPVLGNIIPDVIAVIRAEDQIQSYLVEVEISNNAIGKKIKNYNEFFLKDCLELLGFKPKVLFVTNKKIPQADFQYEVIKLKELKFSSLNT